MSEKKQPTIAEELSAARQARGLSLEEVHQQAGISLAVLRGLEAGQFDVVEPVFVRLGLKSYAEFLGLDSEQFLTRFDQQNRLTFQPRYRPAMPAQPTPRRSPTPLIAIGLVAGICCIIAVAYYFFGGTAESVPPAPTPAAVSPPATTVSPPAIAVLPPATVVPTESQPTTAPTDSLVGQASTEPEAADTSAAEAAAQTTEPAPVVLELEARDSTWVQIRWDDAEENFEGIIAPGQRRRFEARDHFVVLSTNPHGLRYWVDGQLLGGGQLGDPSEVLRFRVAADGIELLGSDAQPLAEEAPDAQP